VVIAVVCGLTEAVRLTARVSGVIDSTVGLDADWTLTMKVAEAPG